MSNGVTVDVECMECSLPVHAPLPYLQIHPNHCTISLLMHLFPRLPRQYSSIFVLTMKCYLLRSTLINFACLIFKTFSWSASDESQIVECFVSQIQFSVLLHARVWVGQSEASRSWSKEFVLLCCGTYKSLSWIRSRLFNSCEYCCWCEVYKLCASMLSVVGGLGD